MKKILLMLIAMIFLAAPALADHNGREHGPLDTIVVGVDGMVCDFCARSLEKNFYQRENVKGVIINLDESTMTLEIDKGTVFSDEDINKLVYHAGYKVRDIRR